MRIEFCSLCDESVPLLDLDKGIAVKAKGRVICVNCQAAMSSHSVDQPAASLQFMGTQPSAGTPLQSGGDTTVMEPTAMPGRQRPERTAGQGPLGGMIFAFFTLLVIGTVTAGFHFYDQYELKRVEQNNELRRLAARMQQNAATQDRRVLSAVRASEQLPGALSRIEQLEANLAGIVQGHDADSSDLLREVNLLKGKLSQLDVLIERLEGNERDTGQVAASLADVFDDVLGLQRRLDSAEAIAAAMPEPASVEDAPPAEAPWLGQLSGLEDQDPGTRWLAVTAIGEFGDPACAQHLIPRLKDEDVFVRMAAARILGEVRANSAIESLIDALEDEQNTVRQAAMLALRSLTGESLKFDADEKPAVRDKRIKAWRDWWKKNKSKFVPA